MFFLYTILFGGILYLAYFIHKSIFKKIDASKRGEGVIYHKVLNSQNETDGAEKEQTSSHNTSARYSSAPYSILKPPIFEDEIISQESNELEQMEELMNSFYKEIPVDDDKTNIIEDAVTNQMLELLRDKPGFIGETSRVMSKRYFQILESNNGDKTDSLFEMIKFRNDLYEAQPFLKPLDERTIAQIVMFFSLSIQAIFFIFSWIENRNEDGYAEIAMSHVRDLLKISAEEHEKVALKLGRESESFPMDKQDMDRLKGIMINYEEKIKP